MCAYVQLCVCLCVLQLQKLRGHSSTNPPHSRGIFILEEESNWFFFLLCLYYLLLVAELTVEGVCDFSLGCACELNRPDPLLAPCTYGVVINRHLRFTGKEVLVTLLSVLRREEVLGHLVGAFVV